MPTVLVYQCTVWCIGDHIYVRFTTRKIIHSITLISLWFKGQIHCKQVHLCAQPIQSKITSTCKFESCTL